MLNRKRSRKTNDRECLLSPVYERIELEQYIFALLLNTRERNIEGHTIFSGVHRLYTERYKRKKSSVNKYNMQDAKDRIRFVRWMKNCLFSEMKTGNMRKQTFINDVITIREMLEIGGVSSIDIPAFIFFLDRLTGWMEFYNFVSVGDSCMDGFRVADTNESEKKEIQIELEKRRERADELIDIIFKCTNKNELPELIYEAAKCFWWIDELEFELIPNEDFGPDYAAFEDLINYNHIAFLYVWGKYIGEYKFIAEGYHSILGRYFMKSIAEAYGKIMHNKRYAQRNDNIAENSIWYMKLFEELFVNDILKMNMATRLDALNFYDAYITYMQ